MKYLAEEGELGQARSGHSQCADQPIVAGATLSWPAASEAGDQ